MTRYFFHVRDQSEYLVDEEGVELPDGEAAFDFALRGARSIICDDVERGRLSLDGGIDVDNAAEGRVLTLTFRQADGWDGSHPPPAPSRQDGGRGS